jgi:hypothetical protein
VLQQLDPDTLRPVAASPLAGELGPGALVVAAGTRSLWVRSGGGGDSLWCLDPASGASLQRWSIGGRVASTSGVAVVASASGLLGLRLDGCPG